MTAKNREKLPSSLEIVFKNPEGGRGIFYEMIDWKLVLDGQLYPDNKGGIPNWGGAAMIATVWLIIDAIAAWAQHGSGRREVEWTNGQPGSSVYPLRRRYYDWVSSLFGSRENFCRVIGQTDKAARKKTRLFLNEKAIEPTAITVKIGDDVNSAKPVEGYEVLSRIADNLLEQWKAGGGVRKGGFDPNVLFKETEQAELFLIAERSLRISRQDCSTNVCLALGLARKLHFASLALAHLQGIVKELEGLGGEERKPQADKNELMRNDAATLFERFVDFVRPFREETEVDPKNWAP